MVVIWETILESVGVATIPTAGILAILAAVHPIIAPPPITPTTTSVFTSRQSFAASLDALSVLTPALRMVILLAAWPPAWGMLVLCQSIPFFLNR